MPREQPGHLNTPRLLTNSVGQPVWKWDNNDPFGGNVPDENPSGLGTFTCNLRAAGQYADKETGLLYNWHRTLDSGIGRYIQFDPIGLRGGINGYLYVGANPLSWTDPSGLRAYQCRKPLDAVTEKFGSPAADYAYRNLPYMYHQYSCVVRDGKVTCGGQDHAGSPLRSPGKPSNDSYNKDRCEVSVPDNSCFDSCLIEEWGKPRPTYGIPFGSDCQNYDNDINSKCRKKCGLK